MAAKKKATAKKTTKKTAAKAKKPAAKKAKARTGMIAHTELASTDPNATKAWAKKAFGWKFGPSMPTPGGEYHMWDAGNDTGGGIRGNMPQENPGTVPYVEVANIKRAYDKAIKAGAKPMMPPEAIPGGMGWIAVVIAPGGPAIGMWASGK